MVLPRHRLTYDPEQPITRALVSRALDRFGLTLTEGETAVVIARNKTRPAEPAFTPIQAPEIEEIIVSSSLHEFRMNQVSSGILLDRENLERRVSIANDVARVASSLPGSASNGVSARPAVRGGLVNETLITMDGYRLYEPFHLHHFQDLFSAFDDRTVDSIQFITGGFPAHLGDRMSGVMQIDTITPSDISEQVREIGLGFYTASYLQSGTLLQQPYVLSVRRSTIDLIGRGIHSDIGTPAFGDLFFRTDIEISDNSQLSVNLLWFGDDIDINNSDESESARTAYGSTNIWTRLDVSLDESMSHSTTLGFTAIKDDREGFIDKEGVVSGQLSDDQEFRVFSLDHAFRFKWDRTSLLMGGSYRYLDAEYDFSSSLRISPAFSELSNYERPDSSLISLNSSGQQLALFVTGKRMLSEKLYLEAGLRLDMQDYLSDSGWKKQVSPRISLLYRLLGGDLRISWGKFAQAQGIHELDISEGFSDFQLPQKSEHAVIGYSKSFEHVDVRLEAYQKRVNSPAFYFANLADPVSLIPELRADRILVDPDHVTAKGIELSLHAIFGSNEFWFNYTRANVVEDIDSTTVPRGTDQKHAAKLGWTRPLGDWQISAEAGYHAGWPTTGITLDDENTAIPARRNSSRLPSHLSIDVNASRAWQFRRGDLRLELGITNLINRENQLGQDYNVIAGPENDDSIIFSPANALPIAPFVDVYWRF